MSVLADGCIVDVFALVDMDAQGRNLSIECQLCLHGCEGHTGVDVRAKGAVSQSSSANTSPKSLAPSTVRELQVMPTRCGLRPDSVEMGAEDVAAQEASSSAPVNSGMLLARPVCTDRTSSWSFCDFIVVDFCRIGLQGPDGVGEIRISFKASQPLLFSLATIRGSKTSLESGDSPDSNSGRSGRSC